ncbi:exported hypothetical protein [uncultured Sporomusa sp.]|uniref:Uncharacterized protein n=1 Tax=uncultured Sporomusa sp. TaxID=307249 RepID=A0A212LY44_9FIRM|nr:hypothetical protein [uncultured Sporomusa sp.]SCM82451.1 exported hypothetical protein [uncultured Sporomusa sp.]
MKKALLLICLLFCLCMPVYAAEVDDAKEIVSMSNEVHYWVADIDKLHKKCKAFTETYPKGLVTREVVKLHITVLNIMGIYHDTDRLGDGAWMKFYNNPENRRQYPDIDRRMQAEYGWSNDNLILVLWDYGKERQKNLEIAITENFQ